MNTGNSKTDASADTRGDRLRSLTETEIRYHGLLDTVPDLVFIIDSNGNISEANRAACDALGCQEQELVGKRFRSLYEAASLGSPADTSGRYGGISGIRVVLRTHRGAPTPVEMWTTARLDSFGEFAGSLVVARPIDETTVHREIAGQRSMLDEISDALQLGISVHSASYEIAYQNEYLKKSHPGTIGARCYKTYRGLDAPCEKCTVREAMAQGTVVREVVSGPTPTGEKSYYEITGIPVKDSKGNVTGGFEIIREVTNLRNKLLELDRLGEGARLTEVQGEVNQPLAGISGYSELLKNSINKEDPAYRYATKIYEQSQRLATLVKKINGTTTIQKVSKTDSQTAR